MYCDPAILVKLLCPEPDSVFFEQHLVGRPLASSELARTEVFSALSTKLRSGQLKPADHARAWDCFLRWLDDATVDLLPLGTKVLHRAEHVISRCGPDVPVRTLDAIHVATCDLDHDFPLAATDGRLRAAAHRLGIPLFPDTLPQDDF